MSTHHQANGENTVRPRRQRQRNHSVGDILRALTASGDALLFFAVQAFAFWLRLRTRLFEGVLIESPFLDYGPEAFKLYLSHFILGTLMFMAIGASFGIYARNAYLRPRLVLGDLMKTCVAWMLGYLLFSLVFKIEPSVSRVFVVLSGVLGFVVLAGWRIFFGRLIRRCGLLFHVQERLLVVGWTQETDALWRRLNAGASRDMVISGILPVAGLKFAVQPPPGVPLAGTLADLEDVLKTHQHDAVLLADTSLPQETISRTVQICHRELIRFLVIPAYFEVLFSGLHLESIRGVPVLSLGRLPLDALPARACKRAVDVAGALAGLLISLPLMVVAAILVQRESRGPVFFAQERVGRRGELFKLYKLRTMQPGAAAADHLRQSTTPDDERLLRAGALLRKLNIDETPQFWNVLKGEMSLVGPRPERPFHASYLRDEIRHYNVRLSVKPGMTGWAAVNGWRGDTDLGERIRFDLDYIERWSLPFDFYIMLLTLTRNRNAC